MLEAKEQQETRHEGRPGWEEYAWRPLKRQQEEAQAWEWRGGERKGQACILAPEMTLTLPARPWTALPLGFSSPPWYSTDNPTQTDPQLNSSTFSPENLLFCPGEWDPETWAGPALLLAPVSHIGLSPSLWIPPSFSHLTAIAAARLPLVLQNNLGPSSRSPGLCPWDTPLLYSARGLLPKHKSERVPGQPKNLRWFLAALG